MAADPLEDGDITCAPFFSLKFGEKGIFDRHEAEVARKYIRLRPVDYDQKSLVRMMDGAELTHRVRFCCPERESVAGFAQRFIDADLDLRGKWTAYWFPIDLNEYIVFGFSHPVDAVTCKLVMA